MIQPKMQRAAPGALQPNPWNSNYVPPDNEAKLLESIRRFGVYKPVVCREIAGGVLEILGGQHRAAAAHKLGITEIDVVNLGPIDDRTAKAIGLADNGRYGDDDLTKLSQILAELGEADAALFLPFSDEDLASIMTAGDINLDDLDMPDTEGAASLPDLDKPTATHQLLKFKVPLGDAGAVTELIDWFIKAKGYAKDEDSLSAAGLALVDIARAAKTTL